MATPLPPGECTAAFRGKAGQGLPRPLYQVAPDSPPSLLSPYPHAVNTTEELPVGIPACGKDVIGHCYQEWTTGKGYIYYDDYQHCQGLQAIQGYLFVCDGTCVCV